jgi:battenin
MLPLLLVYIAEYTINQGVAPTLLFPLESSPFDEYRSFYSTYNAIYQVGVFISRSSTPFIRIHHLYVPSFVQFHPELLHRVRYHILGRPVRRVGLCQYLC